MKGFFKVVIVLVILAGLATVLKFEFANSKRIQLLESQLKNLEAKIDKPQVSSEQPAEQAPAPTTANVTTQSGTQPTFTSTPVQQTPQAGGNINVLTGTIGEKGLCGAFFELAEKSDVLCAHAARILYWKLDLTGSLQRGDKITVLYTWPENEKEPTILALNFSGVTKVKAYKFKPSDSQFASYFDESGVEIPARLEGSPINEYEQITAFFEEHRGRYKHKGVDFKAPVGTSVYAPFSGTIARQNWNWRANGNCIQIKVDGQNLYVIFLHLNENLVKTGQHVNKGDLVAKSGNTGKTTAPNLHYQLEKEMGSVQKPVDPMRYHKLYHRKLEGAQLEAFKAEAARLDSLMKSNP